MRARLVAGVALSLILQAQRARAQPDAKGMRLSVNRVPHSRAVAVSMQVEVDAPLVYVQRVLLEVPAYPDWIPRVQWVRVRATGSRWLLCESALNLPWPLEDVRETVRVEWRRVRAGALITWQHVRGDLRRNQGQWLLKRLSAQRTSVQYQAELELGAWVPEFLIRRPEKKEAPWVVDGLRKRAAFYAHAGASGHRMVSF